jgi:hypothetical protein
MAFKWDSFKSKVWSAANVGDSIDGRLVDIEVRDGRSGKVPVLTVETADGYIEVWAGAVDLRTKLADAAPQPGQYLSIAFTGEVYTGQPSPMKEFHVTVADTPDGAF